MTMTEVFEDNIKDLYNAEKQLTKALPKLVKKASDPALKQALEMHLQETEEHVRRLEQCAEMLDIKPTGKVCHGMMGLIDEANEHVGELKPGPVMDGVIILCGQKAEHYEMTSYGTLCEWGKLMGRDDIVKILKMTMSEEEKADQKLTELAEGGINQKAMSAEKESMSKTTTTRTNGMKTPPKREKAMSGKK